MAYIGSSPTKVVSRQSANIFTYTATANQTAFTGTDANGNTLACTPSDIMVHMNGLRLEESDFTATTTTVTLGSGAAVGDEVTITAFVTFETADAYTKSASDTRYVNTTGGTMSGDLTVDTNTFHVDVADNRVGIGTSTPEMGRLQINEDAAASTAIFIRNRHNVAGTHSDITFGYGEAGNSYGAGIRFRQVDTTHGGQIELYTDNASGAYTKQMEITENGHVTMPNQPSVAGRAIRPIYGSGYANSGVNLYFADMTHNTGNHFNNSTGVWTCPVAGRYWCYAAFLIDDNQAAGGLARFAFLRNGTEFFVSYNHDKYGSSYGGTHTTGGIFSCAANDTITCKVTHGQFHTGAESSFSICLLG